MTTFTILGIPRQVSCLGNGMMRVYAENINGTDYLEYDRGCEISKEDGCTCHLWAAQEDDEDEN